MDLHLVIVFQLIQMHQMLLQDVFPYQLIVQTEKHKIIVKENIVTQELYVFGMQLIQNVLINLVLQQVCPIQLERLQLSLMIIAIPISQDVMLIIIILLMVA